MAKKRFNKLWGLKKLRVIAKGSRRFSFAQFKVYEQGKDFQAEHAMGKERLLIRTDEKGKAYKHLAWVRMERKDADAGKSEDELKNEIENARKSSREGWRTRVIMHPTKPRKNIAFTGQVRIEKRTNNKTLIRVGLMTKPDERKHIHRGINFEWFEFGFNGKKIKFLPRQSPQKYGRNTIKIVENCLVFAHKAIKSRQVKPRKRETIAHFLSFDDSPQKPEFYDLEEFRK